MSTYQNYNNLKDNLRDSHFSHIPSIDTKFTVTMSQNPNLFSKEGEDNINQSQSDIEVNTTTYPAKIIFLGDSGVGKTSIIQRFINNKFAEDKVVATITVSFENKKLKIDPYTELNLQIWDTAGQERFRSLTSSYIRGSNGIFIVFDLGNRESFENINTWIEEIKTAGIDEKNCVIMLIGNKLDSENKKIDDDTAHKFAEEKGFKYLPVSAKDGVNIISMFEIMGDDCLKAILKEESNNENEFKEDIKKSQRSLNEVNDKQIKKPEKKVVNLSKKKLNKNKEKRCC